MYRNKNSKILDADIFEVGKILSKELLSNIILATIIIIIPVAYFASVHRLNSFVYHISLSWVLFAITLLGIIASPSKEEASNRFQSYFDRVEFAAWDDMEPPVIRISKDGSMAYIMVQKFVHLKVPQPNGEVAESKTNFAGMETWEKIDGAWKMKVIASTGNQNK